MQTAPDSIDDISLVNVELEIALFYSPRILACGGTIPVFLGSASPPFVRGGASATGGGESAGGASVGDSDTGNSEMKGGILTDRALMILPCTASTEVLVGPARI